MDIRTNPNWNLDDEDFERTGLTVYWFTAAEKAGKQTEDADEDEDEAIERGKRPSVHTVISAIDRDVNKKKTEHCKIYVAAKISAKDRAHVISRIRFFAQ